ncbi:phosphotransferase enzyme family protein [Micromonospora sp. DT227]|uniref:phosphotransferase enzyme family protein n=1 Tax=Micromonospora sp. DT227 TaxID=3393433 RepID=UPI003CF3AAEF
MGELPIGELRAAIDAVFDLGPLDRAAIRLANSGAMGRIWHVDTGDARYAVKEYFWGVDQTNLRRETALQAASAVVGVRFPTAHPTRDGHLVGALPEHVGGAQLRAFTWVSGSPVDITAPDAPERLGELLAHLHDTAPPAPEEPDPWYEVVSDQQGWDELCAAAETARAPWSAQLRGALPALRSLAAMTGTTAPGERIVCHLDLQPGNLLQDDAGWVLLDWDNTGPGRADRELAATLLRWFGHGQPLDLAASARALRCYRNTGGPADLAAPDVLAMHAATTANFILAMARLALDATADPDRRGDAAIHLGSTLAGLPGPDDYHRLRAVGGHGRAGAAG